jgi:hypothetical protein
MKEKLAFLILMLVWIPVHAASFPTEDDLRGIMYLCSQGFSASSGVRGNLDADASVLRLLMNLEAGISAKGEISKEEIGAILNKTFSEKGSIEVHKLYHECLNQHLLRLMSGGELSGPGFQRTANFTLFAQDAQIVEDTAIIAISATFHDDSGRPYRLDFDTVRAVSSDGGIFNLVDDSGLSKGFNVSKNDKMVMNLIFKRTNDIGKDKPEAKLRVSGKFNSHRYRHWSAAFSFPIGISEIDVRK